MPSARARRRTSRAARTALARDAPLVIADAVARRRLVLAREVRVVAPDHLEDRDLDPVRPQACENRQEQALKIRHARPVPRDVEHPNGHDVGNSSSRYRPAARSAAKFDARRLR